MQLLAPWLLAIALSLVFHWWVVEVNPSLLIGGSLRVPDRGATLPPIIMEEVESDVIERELPALLDRFAQKVPVVNDVAAEDFLPPEVNFDAPVEASIGAPQEEPAVSAVTDVDASLPEVASNWTPRQELLTISEPRFEEEILVVPRQVLEELPRVPEAPSITFDEIVPAEPAPLADVRANLEVAALGPVMPGPTGFPGGNGIGDFPVGLPEWEVDEEPSPEPEEEAVAFTPAPEIVELTEEDKSEVTEFEAVEDLLRLETERYVDPLDPSYAYLKIQIHRQGIERLPVLPREVVILQDCSESMTSSKLRYCIKGLYRIIEALSPADSFNIITFRDKVEACFPVSQPADVVRKARGKGFIAELRAYGRTDVYASLKRLIDLKAKDDRPVIALLVTDGRPTMGLRDSSEIIESFTQDNKRRVSVYGIGGGKRANKYLLDFLSFRNRGDSLVVPKRGEIPGALEEIARQLKRPVMMHLSYRLTSSEGIAMYPRTLTDLYLDRPLLLRARVPADLQEFALQIQGVSKSGKHDMVFRLPLGEATPGGEDLRHDWAWQSILDRIGNYITTKDPAEQAAIEELAAKYGISVPYAYSLDATLQR